VIDQQSGAVYSGPSPTKPWTDVCLAHKTGQRISGPLFFGFSDPLTQRAIASLYNERELQAALQVRFRLKVKLCWGGASWYAQWRSASSTVAQATEQIPPSKPQHVRGECLLSITLDSCTLAWN
jgi:hypothetical protein